MAKSQPQKAKSLTRFSTTSLDKFKTKFGKRAGEEIALSPRPLKREGDRLCLPPYMMYCL